MQANRPQFDFLVKGLDDNAFILYKFDSHDFGISSNYHFDLILASARYFNPGDLLEKPAKIIINQDEKNNHIHGIINKWQLLEQSIDEKQYTYGAQLISPLYQLEQNIKFRVFIGQNVIEITKKILQATGFDYQIQTNKIYPKQECMIQFNEPDLAFLERQLSRWGLIYLFEQQADKADLLILDDIKTLPKYSAEELTYQSQSGTYRPEASIYFIEEQMQLQSQAIKLKDYNYQTPEINLEVNSENKTGLSGDGEQYIYGVDFHDIETGQQLVNVYQQAIGCQRRIFIAESDCHNLKIGQSFRLTNHQLAEFNTDYRIIGMKIIGDQSRFSQKNYVVKLTLIKANISYCIYPQQPPKMHHLILATIEFGGGDYPFIDEQGRYQLSFPAGYPVRMAQPFDRMHFPLRAETQVALAFINGDLNRPVIIGAVNSNNSLQNIIRTWGGNEIMMEDQKNQQYLQLATKNQKNLIKFSAKKGHHKIFFASQEGKIQISAKETVKIQTGEDYIIDTQKDSLIIIENSQQLLAKNQGIQYQSGRDILFSAQKSIQTQTRIDNVNLTASKDLQTESNGDLHLNVAQKDLQIQALQGTVHLHANKNLSIQGAGLGNIIVGNGIAITKTGNVNIKSNKIILQAGQINIHQDGIMNSCQRH